MNIRMPWRGAAALAVLALALAGCGRQDSASLIAQARTNIAKSEYRTAIIELKTALQEAPANPEARLLLGQALLASGDPAGAETELRKAIDLKYPGDAPYPLLARAIFEQGEAEKVISEFAGRSLDTLTARAEVLGTVGLAHLALGQKKEARAAIDAALAAKPGDIRATVAQAQLAAMDNDLPKALTLVDAALVVNPDDPQVLLLKAELQQADGRREESIRTLEQIVELKPDAIPARVALISALVRSGQVAPAAAHVDTLNKVAPRDLRTLYAAALVAYAKGDMAAARDSVQQVLQGAPEYVPALYLSGLVNLNLGSLGAAEEALRTVVAKVPADVGARLVLASAYMRAGRVSQAQDALEAGLARTPDDPRLLRAAADAYLAANNPAKAAQLYERAAALDKSDVGSRVRLAEIRVATGDAARGLRDLSAIAEANPAEPRTDMALISAHLRRRELDQALAAAKAMEARQPTSAVAWNIEGAIHTAKRDLKSARASFEKALQLDPAFLAAAYNLARLDVQEGHPDAARERLDQILAKDPKNEQALLAKAELLAMAKAPPADVRAAIERAIAANATSPRPRIALIRYNAQQRDVKATLAAAQAAAAVLPDNAQILEVLAATQMAAGETNQVQETLARVARLQPENPLPLLQLAEVQAGSKDYEAAITSLKKAAALKPDLAQTWALLATVYTIADRANAGIDEAHRLKVERPAAIGGYLLEGEILGRQKKFAEAAAVYREGLAREPSPFVLVRLYGALDAAGKPEEAAAVAKKWQKEHPKDVSLNLYLGQRSVLRKDYRAAIPQFQAVLAIDPDNAGALNNLAWALNETGERAAALQAAERSYRLASNSAANVDTYGWILFQGGDVNRGLELLKTASSLAPADNEIRLHLAKALLKSGNKAAAKAELETVAKQDKPTPTRGEAEKLLKEL